MRKLCLLIPFIALGAALQAQPYYFEKLNAPFTYLTDSTSLNNGSTWSGFQTFNVPIGFTFQYMDSSFTSVDLEATGRLIFDANHYYYADGFVVNGLEDKGSTNSQSPLSYKLTGTSGNHILKIEVRNATFQNDPASTINYQLWLYEANSHIELHMGPNTINDANNAFGNGALSGVFHVTVWNPLTYGYGLAVYGNPLAPQDSSFSGTGINTANLTLTDAPTEGTVYCFTDDSTVHNSTGLHPLPKKQGLLLYPNPTNGPLYVHAAGHNIEHLTVYNALGKQIQSHSLAPANRPVPIDLSALPNGLYVVQVTTSTGVVLERVVKGR